MCFDLGIGFLMRRVSLALMLFLMLTACGHENEPKTPSEAFLWQFERKTEALLDHLENADKITKEEASVLTEAGMLTQDVKVYRYMKVPEAAQEVATHFEVVPLPLLLELGENAVDAAWRARLIDATTLSRIELANQIADFKENMPTRPQTPNQSSEVGKAMFGGCERGSIYSASPGCQVGKYGFTEDGELYFYISERGQLSRLMIERILETDVEAWIDAIEERAKALSAGDQVTPQSSE